MGGSPDFTLSDQVRQTALDAFDAMINQWGKTCTLYGVPTLTECVNCYFDSIKNKSSGRYKPGGPIPFSIGLCPYCKGEGASKVARTDNVQMLTFDMKSGKYSQLSTYFKDIRIDGGGLITKGYMADAPRILRAEKMSVDSAADTLNASVAGIKRNFYKLIAPPLDINSIIQGRYFICAWARIEG